MDTRRWRSVSMVPLLAVMGVLPSPEVIIAASEPPAALVAEPDPVDLGTLAPYTYFDVVVSVINRSDSPVQINTMFLTVPHNVSIWRLSDNCAPSLRDPGESCQIRLRGRASSTPGLYSAWTGVRYDGPDSPLEVPIRWRVPEPPRETVPPVMRGPARNQEMLRAFRPALRKARHYWSWVATDNVGVTGFRTQLRKPGGAWKTVVKPSEPVEIGDVQKVPLTLPTGKRLELRTRARDAAGNVSAWSKRTFVISGYRDIRADSPGLSGAWKAKKVRGGAVGGDVVVTKERDAIAAITLKARGVALIGRKSPKGGILRIYEANGEHVDSVSLYAQTITDLQVLASWAWSDMVERTVWVETIPNRDRPGIALDAWVIVR